MALQRIVACLVLCLFLAACSDDGHKQNQSRALSSLPTSGDAALLSGPIPNPPSTLPVLKRLVAGAQGAPDPVQAPVQGSTVQGDVSAGGPTDSGNLSADNELPLPVAGDGVEFGDGDAALTAVKRLASLAPGSYGEALQDSLKLVDCAKKSGKLAFRAYGKTDASSSIGYSQVGVVAILTDNALTDWQFLLCAVTGGVVGGGPGAGATFCGALYDLPHTQPALSRYYVVLAGSDPHMCKYIFNAHYNQNAYIYRQAGVDLIQPWTGWDQ